MLEYFAIIVLIVSILTLLYSFTAMKKPVNSGKGKKQSMPAPIPARDRSEELKSSMPILSEMEPKDHGRMSETMPSIDEEKEKLYEAEAMGPPGERDRSIDIAEVIERKASLIYWERMCLEEEFDFIVSLHRPDFKIKTPEGSSVHESDETYKLPKTGHVRVVPVCSGCNISPAYRDLKVSALDSETRAEFKVLPLKEGNFDLNVEFQVVASDGQILPLGVEKAKVYIQRKPIDLNIGALNISVSRRVPAFFSMCGSFFGLTSFVLNRVGIDLNEEILTWSATISTGFAGGVMILLALMLLIKGLRPLMREISITLR